MVTETASTIDTVQFFNRFKVFCKHIIYNFAIILLVNMNSPAKMNCFPC